MSISTPFYPPDSHIWVSTWLLPSMCSGSLPTSHIEPYSLYGHCYGVSRATVASCSSLSWFSAGSSKSCLTPEHLHRCPVPGHQVGKSFFLLPFIASGTLHSVSSSYLAVTLCISTVPTAEAPPGTTQPQYSAQLSLLGPLEQFPHHSRKTLRSLSHTPDIQSGIQYRISFPHLPWVKAPAPRPHPFSQSQPCPPVVSSQHCTSLSRT